MHSFYLGHFTKEEIEAPEVVIFPRSETVLERGHFSLSSQCPCQHTLTTHREGQYYDSPNSQ